MSEPEDHRCGECDNGQEDLPASVVAGRDATTVLEPAEHDFDEVAPFVAAFVLFDGLTIGRKHDLALLARGLFETQEEALLDLSELLLVPILHEEASQRHGLGIACIDGVKRGEDGVVIELLAPRMDALQMPCGNHPSLGRHPVKLRIKRGHFNPSLIVNPNKDCPDIARVPCDLEFGFPIAVHPDRQFLRVITKTHHGDAGLVEFARKALPKDQAELTIAR